MQETSHTRALLLHSNHFGGGVLRRGAAIRLFNCAELASHHPLLKLMSHLAVGRLTHAAIHRRLQDRSLVLHCRTLKDMSARIGHGLLHRLLRLLRMVVCLLARLRDDAIRLMAELRG